MDDGGVLLVGLPRLLAGVLRAALADTAHVAAELGRQPGEATAWLGTHRASLVITAVEFVPELLSNRPMVPVLAFADDGLEAVWCRPLGVLAPNDLRALLRTTGTARPDATGSASADAAGDGRQDRVRDLGPDDVGVAGDDAVGA